MQIDIYREARIIASHEALAFQRQIRAEDDDNGDAGGTHATEKSARVVSQHLS